jgi:hypothetical protein
MYTVYGHVYTPASVVIASLLLWIQGFASTAIHATYTVCSDWPDVHYIQRLLAFRDRDRLILADV